MFILVWDAYFDEEIAKKSILSILQDLFSVTCLSIFTTFILSQGITRIINKLSDTLGMLGWGIAGAIASTITAILV